MPPAGFKRSRALWDDARRPRQNKWDEWKALFRAILYELQPVRFGEDFSLWSLISNKFLPFLQNVFRFVFATMIPQAWLVAKAMTLLHWTMVAAAILYYFIIRWIHETLDAGPLVLMITTLLVIFTVGLRDKAEGEVSAYSVFNRGFQRLLGSIDVEQLVNQHVGGAIMGALGPEIPPPENIVARRNPPAAAARRNLDENNYREYDDDDDDSEDDYAHPPQPNRARKSGKKARRKNRDEKLEIRRQREAAMALGLDGTGGQEEIMAMQRLMDDQQ